MDAASFIAGAVVGGFLLVLWVAHKFASSATGEEWASERPSIGTALWYDREFHQTRTFTYGVFSTFVGEFVFGKAPRLQRYTHEDRYGWNHQEERAKYADVIRKHGGICMEDECIKKSRRIEPGAYWHLAHDHSAGHPYAYLGPAHPECNEAEARARGVTWEGMDAQTTNTWDSDPESEDAWRDPAAGVHEEERPWTVLVEDEQSEYDDPASESSAERDHDNPWGACDDPWGDPPPEPR